MGSLCNLLEYVWLTMCLLILVYYTYCATEKLLDGPTTTDVSREVLNNGDEPAFTICPELVNIEGLENIGINPKEYAIEPFIWWSDEESYSPDNGNTENYDTSDAGKNTSKDSQGIK